MQDDKKIQNVVDNVNKRISKIAFPGLRIGRLSKDDFEQVYKKELFALANLHKGQT